MVGVQDFHAQRWAVMIEASNPAEQAGRDKIGPALQASPRCVGAS
jgi:hypothetical protein